MDLAEPQTTLAKLSAPRLHRVVSRERLFRSLDTLRSRAGIWLCGPPGAGKTTLAASWVEARGIPAVWYRLDAGDRDPATLFDYLGELARQTFGAGAQKLPYLTPDYLRDLPGFARRFFRQWFALSPPGTVLVVDDHHEAGGDPVDGLLREALAEVPAHACLMIVTRVEVPPPLLRALTGGHLGRLGWDDLRLTGDETAALVAEHGEESQQRAKDLHARSGGWAAGVMLMSAIPEVRAPAAGGADAADAVFAYFAEEVLDRSTPADRDLLMRTACLPQFTTGMAEALTGHPGASEVLDRLYRDHYFTDRRQAAPVEYRYHDLFRAFLQARAQRVLGETEWREVLARAAGLLDARGEVEAAADLFVRAADWQRLAGTVVRQADSLIARGRWRTVLDWLDAMPESVQRADPWLLYWKGMARVPQDSVAGRLLLEAAFDGFGDAASIDGSTLACAAIMDTYFQSWDFVAPLDRWIVRMMGLLEDPALADGPLRSRAVASLAAALLYREPSNGALPPLVDEFRADILRRERPNERVVGMAFLFECASLMGRFDGLDALIALTEDDVAGDECLPVNACSWWQRGGIFAYRAGDFATAHRRLAKALEMARAHHLLDQAFLAEFSLAMLTANEGALETSAGWLLAMRASLNPQRHTHAVGYHYMDQWLAVLRDDRAAARHIWAVFSRIPVVGVPVNTAYNHAVIQFLVDEGQLEVALARVHGWRAALAGMASPLMDFNLLVMECCVLCQLDREDELRVALGAMCALGAAHGYRTTLSWVPRMMSVICAAALARGIGGDYVHFLIRERRLEPPAPDTPFWPRALEVRVLGGFYVVRDGVEVTFARKAPKKPLALLGAVIAAGPRGLPVAQACQWLWRDLDGDAAREALAAALHRLRTMLRQRDAVRLVDGTLTLDATLVWVDAFAFERLAAEDGEQALALYRGAFLPNDDDEAWTVTARERLRARFVRLVETLGARHEAAGDGARAMDCYRRGIEADPLAETFYQGQMRCLAAAGRHAEGAAVFRQLRQTLSVVLGIPPSAESRRLASTLLGGE